MSAPSSSPPQGIVWIASYPRSGNTWVRTFLHNLLAVMGGAADGAQDINALNRYSTWDISVRHYDAVLGKPLNAASREEIAAARPQVQQRLADRADGLAFVKTHNALVMDRGHPTINGAVTSGAIYLVRNPLDVAISFAHHFAIDVDEAIRRMSLDGLETDVTDRVVHEVYGSWSQHVESWTGRPNRAVLVMRYEDLAEAPLAAFERLARHLLMVPSRRHLEQAVERSSFEELRGQEERAGFREKPQASERFFRAGRTGQWREQLTVAQVERVIAAHRAQMARFGYLRGID